MRRICQVVFCFFNFVELSTETGAFYVCLAVEKTKDTENLVPKEEVKSTRSFAIT